MCHVSAQVERSLRCARHCFTGFVLLCLQKHKLACLSIGSSRPQRTGHPCSVKHAVVRSVLFCFISSTRSRSQRIHHLSMKRTSGKVKSFGSSLQVVLGVVTWFWVLSRGFGCYHVVLGVVTWVWAFSRGFGRCRHCSCCSAVVQKAGVFVR